MMDSGVMRISFSCLVLRFRNNVPMVVKPHHRFCSAKCGPLARD